MRTGNTIFVLLMILAVAGCRGRADEPDARGPVGANQAAGDTAKPTTAVVTCPECAGLGRSPHSGDERPCFLCAGDGRCAICAGEGHHRDGSCASCEGTGKCMDCAGDGQLSARNHDHGSERARVSGGCPVCVASLGFCPECGGRGERSPEQPCHFCEGQSWCPECRGSGANRLCGGEGICPLCRGRGGLLGMEPAPGSPPLCVHLREGGRFDARLLAAPTRILTIERSLAARVVREAVSLAAVAPNDVLLAFRLFATPADFGLRIAAARYLLNAESEYLSAARHDANAARAAGAADGEIDLLLARIDALQSAWLLGEVGAVVEADPTRALVLLSTHRLAFPDGPDAAEAEQRFREVTAALGQENARLPEDVRERRAAALAERIRRLARRAEEWRVRAEDLLARTDADADDFLRANRAALEAWTIFSLAANRAGPELAPDLLRNAQQARALRIRSLVGLASCLLQDGYLQRARALGIIARSLDPLDSGSIQFVAEVEAALGRQASEVNDR